MHAQLAHFGDEFFVSFSVAIQFSGSVVSDSLRCHELQHARPPCPSPTPGVHSELLLFPPNSEATYSL